MKKYIIIIAIVAIIATLLIVFWDYLNIESLLAIVEGIRGNPWSPVIFVFIYAIAVTFMVPASALTLISAPIFGFWGGLLLTVIGSNLGCQISYFIAKLLGKDFVAKFIRSGSFLDKSQKFAQNNGFIFMMYARLIPIFPFAVVNYFSGIVGIKYRDYTIATVIGMLPGSAVYVYLGYSAADVTNNPIGLIVSIGVLALFTVAMTIIKKKGLFERAQKKSDVDETAQTAVSTEDKKPVIN